MFKELNDVEYLESLGDSCKLELMRLLCGKRLSWGSARVVYECALDESRVVKIEDWAQSFQNVLEWELWQNVQYSSLARWFAPCYAISGNGTVLIQARTTPVSKLPKSMPSFFSDIKLENFGLYKGRVVCHDYGLNLSVSEYLHSHKRMRTLREGERVRVETP